MSHIPPTMRSAKSKDPENVSSAMGSEVFSPRRACNSAPSITLVFFFERVGAAFWVELPKSAMNGRNILAMFRRALRLPLLRDPWCLLNMTGKRLA